MIYRKLFAVLLTLVAVALIAGCGDDESDSGDSETTGAGQAPAVTGKIGEKPEIATPEGDPPTELVIKDIEKGKGKKAADGDNVTVQYVGNSWSTGDQFDASWDNGQPFEFQLGGGQVIDGWDEGVKGMLVGGRRELVIPPDLGYGAQGSPPAIAANETLVFVVDLEKVSK